MNIAQLGIKVTTDGVLPAATQLDRLDKSGQGAARSSEQLATAWKKNTFSSTQLYSANQALTQYKTNLANATKGAQAYTMSAKALSAANRQLPAQFTDLFTQVASGQGVFRPLIQQGGQIKDVYGGIAPALKAVGTYALGMVNPFTLSAAAVGALAVSMYRADDITDKFGLAIAKSGNYAETSEAQLSRYADQVEEASKASFSTSASALTAAVSSGQIGANNLLRIATAAAQAQDTLGASVEDTIATYVKLGDKPLDTLLSLNNAENFLTAAQVQRIAQLEDEGDKQGAVNESINIYLGHQDEMTEKVRAAYSPAKEFWKDLKVWIDDVTVSLGDAGLAAADTLVDLTKGLFNGGAFSSLDSLSGGSNTSAARAVAAEQARIADQRAASSAQAAKSESEQAKIAAQNVDFNRQTLALKKQVMSADEEIADITEKGIKSGISVENIARRVQAIRDREAKKQKKSPNTGIESATASAALQAYKDQLAQEKSALDNGTKELKAQYDAREITVQQYYDGLVSLSQRGTASEESTIKQEIAYLQSRNVKGKESIDVQKQIKSLEAQLATVRADGASKVSILGIEESRVLSDRKAAMKAYKDALDQETLGVKANIAAQVQQISMGDQAYERQKAINDIVVEGAKKLTDLANAYANVADKSELTEKKGQLEQQIADQVRAQREGFTAIDSARANWVNGFGSAFNNILVESADTAGQMKSLFQDAFSGATDAITDFVFESKSNFGDLITDLLKQWTRIQVQKGLASLLGNIGGGSGDSGSLATLFSGSWGFAGGGEVNGPGTSTSDSIPARLSDGEFVINAAAVKKYGAGLFDGLNAQKFATGGRVGRYASGGSVSMPSMGGGSGGAAPSVTVNNYGTQSPPKVETTMDAAGNINIDLIYSQVQGRLATDMASGRGSLYKATKGRLNANDRK